MMRRFAALLPLLGLFAGCLGQARGGSDSETHFACVTDRYCMSIADGLRCIAGHCQDPSDPALGTDRTASLAAPDAGPPLRPESITLTGTVLFAKDTPAPQNNLRVALVWDNQSTSGTGEDPECPTGATRRHLGLVQPAEYQYANGAFTIRISEPPPEAAFLRTTEGANVAQGFIVVYVDGDLDGGFSFANLSAPSADVVVGTSSPLDVDGNIGYPRTNDTYRITYSDMQLDNYGPPFVPGYGIQHWSDYHTDSGEDLPLDVNIPITIDPGLAAGELVCSTVCFSGSPPQCPGRISDLPVGGEGRCIIGGQGASYIWIGTTCDGCRCTIAECDFYEATTGTAPDWPCGAVGIR